MSSLLILACLTVVGYAAIDAFGVLHGSAVVAALNLLMPYRYYKPRPVSRESAEGGQP